MENVDRKDADSRSFHYDHVRLSPERQIALHRQPTWELSYVVTGEGERTIGDTREPFRSGEVVLVVPGMPHCWDFSPTVVDAQGNIENITVTFSDTLLDKIGNTFPEAVSSVEQLRAQSSSLRFVGQTARELAAVLRRMESQSAAMRLVSLLRLLFLMGSSDDHQTVGSPRTETDAQRRMHLIDSYIRCNFKREITVQDISRHVGMNRSALCVFFKRMTGRTFVTYLNDFRMTHARYLLQLGHLSVTEVCYQSGFNDLPYFNRTFKRMTGLTPTQYRHSVQKEGLEGA